MCVRKWKKPFCRCASGSHCRISRSVRTTQNSAGNRGITVEEKHMMIPGPSESITTTSTAVLIVGGGPVGLTVAIELARRGVPCRIIERRTTPRIGTRACTIWQRTLEVFGLMGMPMSRYLDAGVEYIHRTYHVAGFPPVCHNMSQSASRYSSALVTGQDTTERMLTERLAELGVTVERGRTALAVRQDDVRVSTIIRDAKGRHKTIESAWLVVAEGSHSVLRDQLGITWSSRRFPGTQLLQVDAEVRGTLRGDPTHCHLFLGPHGSLGTAPLPDGRLRLYAGVADFEPTLRTDPSISELTEAIRAVTANSDLDIHHARFAWRVRLHNSAADRFRAGRCLLVGDAAHTVIPVAAQGMNTGIQDAFNLGWKLAAVATGRATESLLNSYATERQQVAQSVLQRTERNYWGGTGATPDFEQLHTQLHRIGSIHTGITLAYTDSPLSHDNTIGREPRAGQRAPDGPVEYFRGREGRLYDLLAHGDWTLLEFGCRTTWPTLPPGCRLVRIGPFDGQDSPPMSAGIDIGGSATLWRRYAAEAGAIFLIRPDTYIGYAGTADNPDDPWRYLRMVLDSGSAASLRA
ncbi:FAD-dependent monooxygenase [Nocardia salmonicida]|uniref:FAD-dependent monooxygenase n=1 Tax=Nocardia salmonicida TaxID=53431 RepID=UPI003CE77889